jgi:sulfhydrogenase subunit beta (sulfur reductase)
MDIGDDLVMDRHGFDLLLDVLRRRGLRTIGPVVRDGAIMHGEVSSTADLPEGWHDHTSPGNYRLTNDDGPELFGWAVGPESWKSEFFLPTETVWRATVDNGEVTLSDVKDKPSPVAIVGARPCEIAALGVLDRVLRNGAVPDDRYAARRDGAFVVVVECGSPSGTCFCTSMGTGPAASSGYDLALTELAGSGQLEHEYYVRIGSLDGAEVMALVPNRPADDVLRSRRQAVVDRATQRMGRTLDTDGLPELLARNLEHPRWAEVAERCLSCGNCTLVCPTCFCSDVKDATDVNGAVERRRHWASCFDLDHSYLHGGAVRPSTSSRYRQWMTHKLSTWWNQFDESGCVGCGRCVAWCPVGIDITEEAAAIRASDGASLMHTIAEARNET